MDEEEAALLFGLGLLVRNASAVEYTLHTILVHLKGIPRAYAYKSAEPGTWYIKESVKRLDAMADEAGLTAEARASAKALLSRCTALFEERHRYVHGTWAYDDERQTWLTMRGRRKTNWPEIMTASAEQIWELAAKFDRAQQKLILWDATHFGDGPDESGWYASTKRV
ncbi:hypothetical protein V2J94_19915 [Streptomyces sp. DSM 41524]|uniref:Apea-like HEPN domain-containing protein n=1 Tax=Streptomyces asiaticus subsp. ignotus TaxID=3098222 RepID=A0ABU7PYD8_9ACTN|nr:hypothetical protein [Streptomyces sp. DSM 41524]